MTVKKDQFMWEYMKPKGALHQAEISAERRCVLAHYTSVDALKKILSKKQILFNRIDRVNDGLESKLFENPEVSHLVFVSCFNTQDCESVPMWMIYGKSGKSVRIEFELKGRNFAESFFDPKRQTYDSKENLIYRFKDKPANLDWGYTVKVKDVVYNYQLIKQEPISLNDVVVESGKPEYHGYNILPMGAIKREEWGYEHECRLIAYLRTTHDDVEIPDIEYFLAPITFDNIKRISITYNPWMDDCTKDEIKQLVCSIAELKGKVDFKNSVLTGEIKKS